VTSPFAEYVRGLEAARRAPPSPLTLERLLCDPDHFGLVTASPLQRAVCRIADGLPLGELAANADVLAALGCDPSALAAGTRPLEMLLLAGIRAGKSLLAAALAVRASQTCDLSGLGPGDQARVSVLSLRKDLADVVLSHICGNMLSKPRLRALLVGEPTADGVVVRHPSGREVEIKVVAGARAGATLVARWSAGAIFDEAPRMIGADDGVVNLDDARAAVMGRLLPGAQVFEIGSPWAPFGPIYNMVQEHWGKPSASLVVLRATSPSMNPVWWTPARVAELREKNYQVYRTDVLGEFAEPESTLYPLAELERATRAEPTERPPEAGAAYSAAMDPATRSNAWTFVIAQRTWEPSRYVVALARQWKPRPGAPLSPAAVMADIAAVCRAYGVGEVRTDGWSSDAIADIARPLGLEVTDSRMTAAEKVDRYECVRTYLAQGELELPPVPEVRADLLSVRKAITQTGLAIKLPNTSDGRHADYAPAVVLAVTALPTTWQGAPPKVHEHNWEHATGLDGGGDDNELARWARKGGG
jgi:hypothetical protein